MKCREIGGADTCAATQPPKASPATVFLRQLCAMSVVIAGLDSHFDGYKTYISIEDHVSSSLIHIHCLSTKRFPFIKSLFLTYEFF